MYSSKKVIKRGSRGADIQNYLTAAQLPHRIRADEVWKFFTERKLSESEEDEEADERGGEDGLPEEEGGVSAYPSDGEAPEDAAAGEDVPEAEPERSEAQREAQEILDGARAEAERIRADAEQEAERLRETAREKGYEEGFQEGQDAGRAEAAAEGERAFKIRAEDFRKETERVFRQIENLKKDNLRLYLNELKDVAVKVAEKVIHVSLQSSGEIIKRMILNEADKMRKTSWLKIYIDKADYQMLVKADANIASELSTVSESIKFVVMERDDSGNVILETPEEIVDIGVRTQMENLRERLSQVEVDAV